VTDPLSLLAPLGVLGALAVKERSGRRAQGRRWL
jgi:hypothetical protein